MGLVREGQAVLEVEEHLDELAELARSAEYQVVGRGLQRRRAPHPKTFIGPGKAAELAAAYSNGASDKTESANGSGPGASDAGFAADVVIFDDDLSPSQVKKLEEILDRPVLDRSALILDLFQLRARTREARTQVELARLNYLLPRLTRRWTHLSRQVGGIGVRGGEGETQLEADRRMLRTRIKQLGKELAKIEKTRDIQRRGRRQAPVIALAGYTNAGKSTLFNRLTRAGVKAEDKLFATLDPRLRRGSIGVNGGSETAVFADTVGFIRKLPHHLVASFRSTLEEIAHADVVLHVIDRGHPKWHEQMEVGEALLDDLEVDRNRILTVFNKSDLWEATASDTADAVVVSARTGAGLDDLKSEIQRMLAGQDLSAATRPRDRSAARPV